MSFDRYSQFRVGNGFNMVPFGEIPKSSTDIYEVYRKRKMRLDQLSSQYYDSPDYAWLIMQANPEYGSMEFEIPDGAELRIPYPLNVSIDSYELSIRKYYELN